MKAAMEFIQERRPSASPNAGFAAALSDLEEDLHGCRTVKVRQPKLSWIPILHKTEPAGSPPCHPGSRPCYLSMFFQTCTVLENPQGPCHPFISAWKSCPQPVLHVLSDMEQPGPSRDRLTWKGRAERNVYNTLQTLIYAKSV